MITRVITFKFGMPLVTPAPALSPKPSEKLHALKREIGGFWDFAPDPENEGVQRGWTDAPPTQARQVTTGMPWEYWEPGYDGAGWYWKEFTAPGTGESQVSKLTFDAVSYWCECWLNGQKIGEHEGLSDPFSFDVSGILLPGRKNQLVVRVINPPHNHEVDGLRSGAPLNQSDLPVGKAGWYYNYGGLWGKVWLEVLPPVHFLDLSITPSLKNERLNISWQAAVGEGSEETSLFFEVIEPASGRTLKIGQRVIASDAADSGEFSLSISGLSEWHPDAPVLYDLQASISTRHSTHVVRRRFGIREFTVRDRQFHLNGRPIILKGILQQRAYPRRLASPASWRLAARELITLKRAGLNFLRIHLGPAEPWYLDIADRLGILVMMEPPIGWIANGPHTEGRISREIQALIAVHRSRTCIVMWGLFNESFHLLGYAPGEMRDLAERMLHVAHASDPSRLVIDTSGGYARASVQGAETMIHDTSRLDSSRFLPAWSDHIEQLTDVHVYCSLPPTNATVEHYARLDSGNQLLFLAEYGAAETPPDFRRVLETYTRQEQETGLEDWRLHRDFYESLRQRFEAAGLADEFGTVENWIAAVNHARAGEVADITVAIRSNPKTAGFCLCQLADASGELFGALDFWRRPKPLLKALSSAIANPAAGIETSPTWLATDQGLSAIVRVVSDEEPVPGGDLEVTLRLPSGKTQSHSTEIPPGGTSRTAQVEILQPAPEAGIYRMEATLRHGSQVTSSQVREIGVINEKDRHPITISGRLAKPATGELLRACNVECEPFGNNHRDKSKVVLLEWSVIAASANSHWELLGQIRNIVEAGGSAVILNPETPMLYRWLLPHFIGVQPVMRTSTYLKRSPLLNGLGEPGVAGRLYAEVLGDRWDSGDDVVAAGGTVEIGAFSMNMWTRPAAYFWGASVYRIPIGRGTLFISHLNLLPTLGKSPLSRQLLRNLLDYAGSQILPGNEHRLFRRCIDRTGLA